MTDTKKDGGGPVKPLDDWAYKAMYDAAMSLPPSDFGSHRALEVASRLLRADRANHLGTIARLREALEKAKAFHDVDSGLNGFTADYEILRVDINAALALSVQS